MIWRPGRACQLMAEVQVMAGLLNFQPVVALSGGSLSASAQNGQQGTVLIDPAALEINADMPGIPVLPMAGQAHQITLFDYLECRQPYPQADDNITVAQNVTISSQSVKFLQRDSTSHRRINWGFRRYHFRIAKNHCP